MIFFMNNIALTRRIRANENNTGLVFISYKHYTLFEVFDMLGDLIYEALGKIIGMRVLDDNGKIEMTLQEQGEIFGSGCSTTLTLVGKPEINGVQYMEGYGILMTKDGDTATITLNGRNIPKGLPPLAKFLGAVYMRTQSPKLPRLNSEVYMCEAEMNEDMSYNVKLWEWK
jgi:hypothetical protein